MLNRFYGNLPARLTSVSCCVFAQYPSLQELQPFGEEQVHMHGLMILSGLHEQKCTSINKCFCLTSLLLWLDNVCEKRKNVNRGFVYNESSVVIAVVAGIDLNYKWLWNMQDLAYKTLYMCKTSSWLFCNNSDFILSYSILVCSLVRAAEQKVQSCFDYFTGHRTIETVKTLK